MYENIDMFKVRAVRWSTCIQTVAPDQLCLDLFEELVDNQLL